MKQIVQDYILSAAAGLLALAAPSISIAESVTWSANPSNSDWNTAANWMPNAVPNGPLDMATFEISNTANISLSNAVEVDGIAFASRASPFTITTNPGVFFRITGLGITNSSGSVQNFVLQVTDAALSLVEFKNSASAGQLTAFSNFGGEFIFSDEASADKSTCTVTGAGARQGHLTFSDISSAAQATIAVNGFANATFVDSSTAGEAAFTTSDGGGIDFGDDSSAEEGSFQCDGGRVPRGGGGGVGFNDRATAAKGDFIINGAAVARAVASNAIFDDIATAGDATFVINGGTVAGAEGAFIEFFEDTSAGNATITINGGINSGEGASLFFFDHSEGSTASIGLFDDGQMDIGNRAAPGVTIGSLEGNGRVFLGPKALVIGSNNRSTAFAGTIQDGGINQGTGGTLTKIGSGVLTLSGANTYTGQTTLSAGALAVRNTTGSATGTGPVQVNGGTLAGAGSIAGAVTLGSGSGTGAVLSPGQGASKPTRLTLESSLTLKADATYRYRLNLKKAKSDLVTANGITIESGAQFNFQPVGRGRVRTGKVATVLNNTAATPIAGTFANLPEGATLEAGGNTLQVSYHGGDGNDLTLTVTR